MKKIKVLILIIIFNLNLVSCSSSSQNSSSNIYLNNYNTYDDYSNNGVYNNSIVENQIQSNYEGMVDESGDYSDDIKTSNDKNINIDEKIISDNNTRKLIKDVYFNIETNTFDKIYSKIKDKMNIYNGYIEKSTSKDDGQIYSGKISYLRLRIPYYNLDNFVEDISTMCKNSEETRIINKEEDVQDITSEYIDIKAHKKTLELEEERILAILKETNDLKNIFKLEEKLSEIRYEIEAYESQIRTYDDLVSYSTVTIDLQEVIKIEPIEEPEIEEKTAFEKMKIGFSNSLHKLKDNILEIVIIIVSNVPFILFYGLIIIIAVLIIKKIFKKNNIKILKKYKKFRKHTKENKEDNEIK